MKKLVVLLFIALVIAGLAACGGADEPPAQEEETLGRYDDGALEEKYDEPPDTGPVEYAIEYMENLASEILYILPELVLFDHDLRGSELLEPATLYLDWGGEHSVQVAVLQGGETWEDGFFVESFWGGLELIYTSFPPATEAQRAVDTLSQMVADAWAYEPELAPSEASAIHATPDGQTALFAAAGPFDFGEDEIGILILQQIPETGDIFMLSIFFLDLDLEGNSIRAHALLTELSFHIGFDLFSLVGAWL